MKSQTTRAFVALVIGGVLTLGAFLGAFFLAGVPDFGFVRTAERVESVRYQGPFDQAIDETRYLQNFAGYDVEVTAGGETVRGELLEADETHVTLATADGEVRLSAAEFDSARVRGSSYGRPDWGQKIFYFHVPVAEISFIVFGFAAFYSLRFIMTKKREYDIKARISMEVTLLFIMLTMATGILWTKAAWGVWWDWEPRLTTYFIMTLLVIAYFVLRNSVEDEERRALYAAAFSILGFIDAPISFFITRLIPSNHPVIERGGLEPPMLVSFIIAQIGMIAFGYAIYQLRMGEMLLKDRIEQAKTQLER
ncbi:MAG TPA: cytochrome c biogenesis protein CcsA [Coriobacteriia bacterium]|nr:cytochrome c biogenesis protein CcsA [Coriobacteriia bacterium]